MDEQEALRIIDEQLDGALAGVRAPAHFAAAVRLRTGVSRKPEILDMIGWAGVLASACALLIYFRPGEIGPVWMLGAAGAFVAIAFTVGLRSLGDES